MHSPWKQFGLEHALGDQRRAARGEEIGGDEAPAGFQVRENRRAGTDAVEIVDGKRNSRFVGDGQQVQNGIRRAAGSGDAGDGIFDRQPW